MNSIIIGIMLIGTSYEDEYNYCIKNNKPLVCVLTAKWCGPCKIMHKIFEKIKYRHCNIDIDEEADLVDKLTDDKRVPQIIVYYKNKSGWHRKQMIGIHTQKEIERFIK